MRICRTYEGMARLLCVTSVISKDSFIDHDLREHYSALLAMKYIYRSELPERISAILKYTERPAQAK
jgi:hypothetical protein